MTTKKKIASLEFARIIAMLAIIGLHCQMALSYWQWGEVPWVGYIINQMSRFAVPLFFLISGYLIQPKLSTNPIKTLKSYAKPLIRIWVVWSVICLVVPFRWQTVYEVGYLAERQGYWDYLMQSPINSLLGSFVVPAGTPDSRDTYRFSGQSWAVSTPTSYRFIVLRVWSFSRKLLYIN